MPTVATKLFREPVEVKEAVNELKSKGYKDSDIVVVASKERAKDIGTDIKVGSDLKSLADMGVSQDTIDYYQFSIPMGSIIVGVKTDESRMNEAKSVLRKVPVCSLDDRIKGRSPGFLQASRMSATNPIDAPMSGDFRRY